MVITIRNLTKKLDKQKRKARTNRILSVKKRRNLILSKYKGVKTLANFKTRVLFPFTINPDYVFYVFSKYVKN